MPICGAEQARRWHISDGPNCEGGGEDHTSAHALRAGYSQGRERGDEKVRGLPGLSNRLQE